MIIHQLSSYGSPNLELHAMQRACGVHLFLPVTRLVTSQCRALYQIKGMGLRLIEGIGQHFCNDWLVDVWLLA